MFQPPTKRLVELRNGDLLNIAEGDGYEVLVSTDTSLKYQQNLSGRRIGIVVLLTTSWHPTSHFPPRFRLLMQPCREVIQKLKSHTPKANKELLPISLVFTHSWR